MTPRLINVDKDRFPKPWYIISLSLGWVVSSMSSALRTWNLTMVIGLQPANSLILAAISTSLTFLTLQPSIHLKCALLFIIYMPGADNRAPLSHATKCKA